MKTENRTCYEPSVYYFGGFKSGGFFEGEEYYSMSYSGLFVDRVV